MKDTKKRIISFIFLIVTVFVAVPKSYIHDLFNHHHSSQTKSSLLDGSVLNENTNTQDCELDKFNTPVHFTIFKFILSLKPLSSSTILDCTNLVDPLLEPIHLLFQLRAPPVYN